MTILSERTLYTKDSEHFGIVELLGETNLLDIVSKLPPFRAADCPRVICELVEGHRKSTSSNFQQTIVRGHTFEFFPSIINQY